jgi:hypothetical protein
MKRCSLVVSLAWVGCLWIFPRIAWSGTELRDADGNILLEDLATITERMEADLPDAQTTQIERAADVRGAGQPTPELKINGKKMTVRELRDTQLTNLAAKAQAFYTKQWAGLAEAREYSRKFDVPMRREVRENEAIYMMSIVNGCPTFYGSFNLNAAKTVSTDKVWPGGSAGLSLSGNNFVIGLWDDGGVRTTHQEFTFGGTMPTRVTQKDGATDLSGHSTRVAGTLIAVGGYPPSKGMSFDGKLLAHDFNLDFTEMANAVISNNLRVSNHSYGIKTGWEFESGFWQWHGDIAVSISEDYKFGFYRGEARDIDDIVYDGNYYLPVWSAGNERDSQDLGPTNQPVFHHIFTSNGLVFTNLVHNRDGDTNGFDTLPPNGVAKNILAIGAVNDLTNGYVTATGVVLASFSSLGPTDDGRIKPDLAANGIEIVTTDSPFDNQYVVSGLSGTSFSAPNVAGSLNLLIQLYASLYGTNRPMLASTLKALAIHTADEAGSSPGPDYRFGWGLFNTRKAAEVITNDFVNGPKAHIKEVVLTDGDYIEFPVESAGTSSPLRVTICWTDPPGIVPTLSVDNTNRMLINDLDLRVFGPGGTVTNRPWILNPAIPTNAASTGDNDRDNVEQVHIASPIAGVYTVQITHKGTLTNEHQNVSIIISGNVPQSPPDFELVGFIAVESPTNLVWPSVVGQLYRVQVATDLLSDSWQDVSADISATKTNVIYDTTTNSTPEVLFYRVVEVD